MTTVREVCAAIVALTPNERYRLASYLLERNEAKLADVVNRSGIVDEMVSGDLDEDPVVLPEVAA